MSCCVSSVVIGQDALVCNRSPEEDVMFPKERHCRGFRGAACKRAIVPVVSNVRSFQILIGSVYSRGGSGRLLVLRLIIDDIWRVAGGGL